MFLIKLLALPLVAAVTLIQWVAIFLTSFSAILFDLLAGIIFIITLAGLMFGVCTVMDVKCWQSACKNLHHPQWRNG